MKRLILSAVALSMLAIPAVESQAAPMVTSPIASQGGVIQIDWRKPGKHVVKKKIVRTRNGRVVKKKVVVRESHWRRGQKYSGWRQHRPVRDWRHHHLRRPGHGQQWIRVGNDYILVGILSGVVAGMIAAH